MELLIGAASGLNSRTTLEGENFTTFVQTAAHNTKELTNLKKGADYPNEIREIGDDGSSPEVLRTNPYYTLRHKH